MNDALAVQIIKQPEMDFPCLMTENAIFRNWDGHINWGEYYTDDSDAVWLSGDFSLQELKALVYWIDKYGHS